MDVQDIRQKVKQLRKERGLRALDMAEKLGISRPFYTQIETGSRRMTAHHLIGISGALGVSIGELCGEGPVKSIAGKRTFNHVIPVNDKRIRKILAPILAESTDDIEKWGTILDEAKSEMVKLRRKAS